MCSHSAQVRRVQYPTCAVVCIPVRAIWQTVPSAQARSHHRQHCRRIFALELSVPDEERAGGVREVGCRHLICLNAFKANSKHTDKCPKKRAWWAAKTSADKIEWFRAEYKAKKERRPPLIAPPPSYHQCLICLVVCKAGVAPSREYLHVGGTRRIVVVHRLLTTEVLLVTVKQHSSLFGSSCPSCGFMSH
jgi:hypothetical protein